MSIAEQRWNAAAEFAEHLSRASVPRLLRLFLFSRPDSDEVKWLTDELLPLDPKFPVSNNAEIARLMAGVVMITTFDGSSPKGYAFALGLQPEKIAFRVNGLPVLIGSSSSEFHWLLTLRAHWEFHLFHHWA